MPEQTARKARTPAKPKAPAKPRTPAKPKAPAKPRTPAKPKALAEPPKPRSMHARMAAVFAGVTTVPKTGRNDFHNYNYVTESDLIATIRPLLAQNGLYLLADDVEVTYVEPGHCLLKCEFTIVSEDGDSLKFVGYGEGRDVSSKGVVGDKALYKAKTGALKYGLSKTFMVDTSDDPERTEFSERAEGRADQGRAKPAQSRSRQQPARPPKPAPNGAAEREPTLDKDLALAVVAEVKRVQNIIADAFEYDHSRAWEIAVQFIGFIVGRTNFTNVMELSEKAANHVLHTLTDKDESKLRAGLAKWLPVAVGDGPPETAEATAS